MQTSDIAFHALRVNRQEYAAWAMPRRAALATLGARSGGREERFVDDRLVPNLEEMDEQQARQFLSELFSVLSAEKEYTLRHEDYAMEMPQSGERIRGPENMREFQRAFAGNSNPPSIRVRPGAGEGGAVDRGGGQRLRGGRGVQRRAHR
jgi:hypothetical protein